MKLLTSWALLVIAAQHSLPWLMHFLVSGHYVTHPSGTKIWPQRKVGSRPGWLSSTFLLNLSSWKNPLASQRKWSIHISSVLECVSWDPCGLCWYWNSWVFISAGLSWLPHGLSRRWGIFSSTSTHRILACPGPGIWRAVRGRCSLVSLLPASGGLRVRVRARRKHARNQTFWEPLWQCDLPRPWASLQLLTN